jgi:predicted nucleic acid-binding protein
MPAGVLLDTSYLITLADRKRPHYKTARRYWREFAERAIPIFLPTIVVSEFYIKQEILPEILRACVVLPFNWSDALMAAKLDFSGMARGGESRTALKDDVKIIAQAIVKDAAWVITDDTRSFYKFASKVKSEGKGDFRLIKLEDDFDLSVFDPSGQHALDFDAEPDEPDAQA